MIDEVVAKWWQTISPVGAIHSNLHRESHLARHPHILHHQFSTGLLVLMSFCYISSVQEVTPESVHSFFGESRGSWDIEKL